MNQSSRRYGRTLNSYSYPLPLLFLVLMALAVHAAHADHGGPHVKLVLSGDTSQDLSVTPLIIPKTGDTAVIDFLVELPSPGDSIYGAEFHFNIDRSGTTGRVLSLPDDGSFETPGFHSPPRDTGWP